MNKSSCMDIHKLHAQACMTHTTFGMHTCTHTDQLNTGEIETDKSYFN